MSIDLPISIEDVKGFMAPEEGEALYAAALEASVMGPCLEIGTYCGKSTVYIGTAVKERKEILFTVDHHRGSEENQPGWEHHDPETWDDEAGSMDTLPFLRRTLREADLEDHVIPIVGRSMAVVRHWQTPLAMLFIDGGHSREHALNDYLYWTRHVVPGGILAIHDVFPNPQDGGRPPFEIFEMALASHLFKEESRVQSLRILRRL